MKVKRNKINCDHAYYDKRSTQLCSPEILELTYQNSNQSGHESDVSTITRPK